MDGEFFVYLLAGIGLGTLPTMIVILFVIIRMDSKKVTNNHLHIHDRPKQYRVSPARRQIEG